MQRLIAQIRDAAARKNYAQARAHLDAALALDPHDPRLQRIRQRALNAR